MPYYPPQSYFNPYLYQPAPVQAPQVPAPTPVPPQAPAPAQTSTAGMIWVTGDKDAALYPVAPNNAVPLWHQSEPIVYLKTADATGKPTLKTYNLVERPETPAEDRKPEDGKLPAYATKDELAAVVGAVRDIDKLISTLTREVDDLKAAKRPKRRAEDDDE